MLDKDLVRRKLGFLYEHLKELEPLTQLSLAEYTSDFIRRHAAEKVAELIVEYAIDTPISLEGGSGAGIGKYSMPQDVRRRG